MVASATSAALATTTIRPVNSASAIKLARPKIFAIPTRVNVTVRKGTVAHRAASVTKVTLAIPIVCSASATSTEVPVHRATSTASVSVRPISVDTSAATVRLVSSTSPNVFRACASGVDRLGPAVIIRAIAFAMIDSKGKSVTNARKDTIISQLVKVKYQ